MGSFYYGIRKETHGVYNQQLLRKIFTFMIKNDLLLCAFRVIYSITKEKHIGGQHYEKEYSLGSKSINSNKAREVSMDRFQDIQKRRRRRQLALRFLQRKRVQHCRF